MKNILKNKLYVILILFITFLCIITTNCFATCDVIYHGKKAYLPDIPKVDGFEKAMIICRTKNDLDYYTLYLSNKDLRIDTYNEYKYGRIYFGGSTLYIYALAKDKDNYVWKETGMYEQPSYYKYLYNITSSDTTWNGFSDVDTTSFVYANYELKHEDGTTVFQLPPPKEIPQITQVLVEETTKTQMKEQLMKMLLGFLKYLVVLVILVISFWKGWKFLSRQLQKG